MIKKLQRMNWKKFVILKDINTNTMSQYLQDFIKANITFRKFKIDKRILHLSTLVVTKQISRNEALKEIEKSTYKFSLIMKCEKIKNFF